MGQRINGNLCGPVLRFGPHRLEGLLWLVKLLELNFHRMLNRNWNGIRLRCSSEGYFMPQTPASTSLHPSPLPRSLADSSSQPTRKQRFLSASFFDRQPGILRAAGMPNPGVQSNQQMTERR